jgi:hypothetical protein
MTTVTAIAIKLSHEKLPKSCPVCPSVWQFCVAQFSVRRRAIGVVWHMGI